MKEILVKYLTTSVEKTVWLGQQLGDELISGDVVALVGDLGGGKTWFTKGIATGLNSNPNEIVSPTFTIVNEYQGRQQIFHIDLYRLNTTEILDLDLEDYFSREGIVVIEWADRWPVKLPENTVHVELTMIGPIIENDKMFPNRTNVEFVDVVNEDELKVRVWERGVGETLSCGTGACAVLVAASLSEKAGREATVRIRGGDLLVRWEDNDSVTLSGPANLVRIPE